MSTKEVEQSISNLVGCLTDPIIVFPGGWEDTLPEWLKTAVTLERLEMNIKASRGEEMTGTDAEACAYLYTAAWVNPLGHHWARIYLYTATKTCRRWGRREVPADITVDSIDDYQTAELKRLKDWLYRQRIKARKERKQRERQQKKEEAQRKARQLALFEF